MHTLNKMMVGLLSAASVHCAIAGNMGPVNTQDPMSWQGFYLGGQVGGAWSRADMNYTNANVFNTFGAQVLGTRFGFDASNAIGGGYVGFNYQTSSPWLVGLEGSYSGTDLTRTEVSPFYSTDRYNSKLSQMGTIQARVGYTHNQWLPYVSGGWAIADTSLATTWPQANVQAKNQAWANGWIVGAGADYRVNEHVALGLVYNYAEVYANAQSMRCVSCTGSIVSPVVDSTYKVQTVMARVSYLIN